MGERVCAECGAALWQGRSAAVRWLVGHFSSRFEKLNESTLRGWEDAAKRKEQQEQLVPAGQLGGAGSKNLTPGLMADICRAILGQVHAGVEVTAPLLRPIIQGIIIGHEHVGTVCMFTVLFAYCESSSLLNLHAVGIARAGG